VCSSDLIKTDMNGKPAKHQSQTKCRDWGAISVNPVREVDTIEAPPKNPPRALTGLGTGGPSRIRPDRRRTDLVEVEDRVLLIFGERALRGLDG